MLYGRHILGSDDEMITPSKPFQSKLAIGLLFTDDSTEGSNDQRCRFFTELGLLHSLVTTADQTEEHLTAV